MGIYMDVKLPSLDFDFEWSFDLTSSQRRQRDLYIMSLKRILTSELTPAAQRLFKAILREGWSGGFFAPVTRNRIALALGHGERIFPHDIRLLRKLVKMGLLIEQRRHRPLTPFGKPTGYELVYSMPDNVIWAYKALVNAQKKKAS